MAGLRDWLRKASEPVVPAAPTPAVDAGEMVDGEVIVPIKQDDHFLKSIVQEIHEACENVLKSEEPVDWWEVSNALAGLTDDLLEELEEEFNAGEI